MKDTDIHPAFTGIRTISTSLWQAHRKYCNALRRGACIGGLLIVMLLITGCQIAQSAFSTKVGNAGAAFAAASNTLKYLHEGKLTSLYARSTFVNYRSELSGLDQQLPLQQGAPGKNEMTQLLNLYRSARQVVNRPCLDSSCDWQAQVTTLDQASNAFLKAADQ
jgi:hypothetical protein